MDTLHLLVIYRLPQSYCRSDGFAGIDAEPQTLDTLAGEDELIALSLLSHDGESARVIMEMLRVLLRDIQIESVLAELQGAPCLFVSRHDVSAAICCLKNQGVAIAETFYGHNDSAALRQ